MDTLESIQVEINFGTMKIQSLIVISAVLTVILNREIIGMVDVHQMAKANAPKNWFAYLQTFLHKEVLDNFKKKENDKKHWSDFIFVFSKSISRIVKLSQTEIVHPTTSPDPNQPPPDDPHCSGCFVDASELWLWSKSFPHETQQIETKLVAKVKKAESSNQRLVFFSLVWLEITIFAIHGFSTYILLSD